jgi:hypothetical protein
MSLACPITISLLVVLVSRRRYFVPGALGPGPPPGVFGLLDEPRPPFFLSVIASLLRGIGVRFRFASALTPKMMSLP